MSKSGYAQAILLLEKYVFIGREKVLYKSRWTYTIKKLILCPLTLSRLKALLCPFPVLEYRMNTTSYPTQHVANCRLIGKFFF
ncbi:MAG: hypothetical protein ACPLZF_06525 [Nitrososphaeria archaeon]